MVTKKRIQTKRSINAKKVALDVIASVSKGKKVNKTKIQIANGYSLESARSNKALRTDTYKETIATFVDRLEKERSRLLLEASSRDISTERYSTLVEAMDKLTKNSQLLQGKSTENVATVVNVMRYDDPTAPV